MEHQRVQQLLGPEHQIRRDQTFRTLEKYCRHVRTKMDKYLQEHNVYENVDIAVKYLISKPLLLAGVISIIFAIGLPILLFTLFAVITVACTFTGFILIEGTILAFGTVLLCGLLLSMITSMLVLGMCLGLVYYICLQVYTAIKKI